MHVNHTLRVALTAVVGSIAITAIASTATAPAVSAQQQCVPEGTNFAPAPWSQQLLAPERIWPLSTGKGQRVAIVGTGVAVNPQLAGRVADQVDLAPPEPRGEPSGATDCLGIGTGVAGIVAARQTDRVGFHGVAPGAQLLSAKVVGDRFAGGGQSQAVTPDLLASAIDWAIDRQATVITVATPAFEDSDTLRWAVSRAQRDDIVVIAATGEVTRSEPAFASSYPAAYDGVLAVSAIGQDGMVTQASRPGDVDLVAPGYEVLTTYPKNGLGPASGSAFAAGYVAGSVALTRSYRPELSGPETVQRMLATAAPAPEGAGSRAYGAGIVNPYQAVVENVVAGEPAELPPLRPATVDPAEQARAEAEDRSDTLALILAGSGIALVFAMTVIVACGPRGRRRRWRSGFAEIPQDRPEDDLPEPPAELFGDRPATRT